MGDLFSTYQAILQRVEDFLKMGIEVLTEEYNKRLATLREMSEILASILTERGHVNEEASEVNQCIVLIVEFFGTLLFESYLEVLTQLSHSSKMVNEMEKEQEKHGSSPFPKFMQAKYDQVKFYLEKANGQLEKIDKMLDELLPKVRNASRNKFKIPDKEIADLEMDKVDVNDDLKACKEYLDKAEEVLCKLEEDINSETWKFTVQMVGATTALAGIGGAGVTLAAGKIAYISQLLGNAGPLAAAGAGIFLLLGLWKVIDRHRTSCKNFVERLKMELQGLQTEYRRMEEKYKKRVTDRM